MEGQHWREKDWLCHLYEGEGALPLVVVPYLQGDGQSLKTACTSLKTPPFHLLVVNHDDWNDVYSPWQLPSPFEQGVSFRGEGAQTLAALTDTVSVQADARLQGSVDARALVGYSMAGLFALYGAVVSETFSMGASVSGSLWAEGLEHFLRASLPKAPLTHFYFSLGSKERKSRNPVLAPLAAHTEAATHMLEAAGIQTAYEINPGNHFTEPDVRMARAIRWLLTAQ